MWRGSSISWRTYIVIVLLVSGPFFLYGMIKPVAGIRHCSAAGYSDDTYLAYCDDEHYGDYEHGALYFDLEPGAVEALRQADILFLGNSRVQYALSTRAGRRFFAERGWRNYDLAFGYGESSDFALALLRRYDLHPAAVIINADPFFTTQRSVVSKLFLTEGNTSNLYLLYATKRLAQAVHRTLCGIPGLERFACGDAPTVFRSRRDGSWGIRHYDREGRQPVVSTYARIVEQAPQAVTTARDFLKETGLHPGCTILTTVPSNFSTDLVAERVAAATAMPLVRPRTAPLFTIDSSHLDSDSAEEWSERFLEDAAPLLEACLAKRTGSAAARRQADQSPAGRDPGQP